jgi:hypothetical protein
VLSNGGETVPNFFRIFPVFRAVAAPALFSWLWGLNVLFWLKTKINYLYILEIDPESHVSYLTVFRVCGPMIQNLTLFDTFDSSRQCSRSRG